MREPFENAQENASSGNVGQPMFRALKEETDGLPKVERSGRGLGVRIDGPIRDLLVGEDGTVEPATGGMSVALDAVRNLPKPRLPKSLGGEGRDPVFTMFTAGIPAALHLRLDRYPHALIEPSQRYPLSHFEADLAGTRTLWSKACE